MTSSCSEMNAWLWLESMQNFSSDNQTCITDTPEESSPGADSSQIPVFDHFNDTGTHDLISAIHNLRTQLLDQQHAENEQSQYYQLFEHIVEIYPDIIYVYDLTSDNYVLINRSFLHVLGYEPDADITQNFGIPTGLTHPEELPLVNVLFEKLQTAEEHQVVEVEYRLKNAQGAWIWFHTRCIVLQRTSHGTPEKIVGICQEITERKWFLEQMRTHIELISEYSSRLERQKAELEEVNRKLEAMATTDGLTSLKNQRAFQERLEVEYQRAARYKTPLSLLLMDIDHFKAYNDSFGHPAGDEMLQLVASLLLENARNSDFVARYGGEEFVIILPNTAKEGALIMAERFRIAIDSAQWPLRSVTSSIGVASLKADVKSRAELVLLADKALYASKRNGRNQVCHYDDVS